MVSALLKSGMTKLSATSGMRCALLYPAVALGRRRGGYMSMYGIGGTTPLSTRIDGQRAAMMRGVIGDAAENRHARRATHDRALGQFRHQLGVALRPTVAFAAAIARSNHSRAFASEVYALTSFAAFSKSTSNPSAETRPE